MSPEKRFIFALLTSDLKQLTDAELALQLGYGVDHRYLNLRESLIRKGWIERGAGKVKLTSRFFREYEFAA